MLLPITYFFLKEPLGPRTVLGTVLAVSGTALIFLAV
ncbi:MAG: hypothetical protein HC915_04930 [Anaerolineae bacterium]|nr:hypothetical protein [Anaerolineae bacterium]